MRLSLRRYRRMLLTTAALLTGAAAWMTREGAAQTPAAAAPQSANVKITFQTLPAVKADVLWGKKRLGVIVDRRRPLIVERPRDSGPMDVTVRAEGYLPVHTRAHTFSDHRLTIKLTARIEKHKLFGYRAPVPDAGAQTDAAY